MEMNGKNITVLWLPYRWPTVIRFRLIGLSFLLIFTYVFQTHATNSERVIERSYPLKSLAHAINGEGDEVEHLGRRIVSSNRNIGFGALVPIDTISGIVRDELLSLVDAGATHIQLDEPSYAVHPDDPAAFVDLFNRTIEGVQARTGLHLCFGNYVGRPVALRTYKPLFPYILDLNVDELVMEFANREMREIELGTQITESGKTLAAGLIDVKNYYIERSEDVANRIHHTLQFVPAEQLVIVPDCGLSQTARWAARAKLKAMVAGVEIVRRQLCG